MMRRSSGVPALGTVPSGDVRKKPIKSSNLEREKGPEYLRSDSSFLICDMTWLGYSRAEL